MKIRKGFVSNSSSSSFMCDISGEVQELYSDTSMSEYGMCRCTNGHEFYFHGFPDVEQWIDENGGFDDDYNEKELPAELCPICNGKAKRKIVEYLKQRLVFLNITPEDLK